LPAARAGSGASLLAREPNRHNEGLGRFWADRCPLIPSISNLEFEIMAHLVTAVKP